METCLNQSQRYIAAKLVCAHNSSKESHCVENNRGKVEQGIHKTQVCTPGGRTDSEFEGSNNLKNRPGPPSCVSGAELSEEFRINLEGDKPSLVGDKPSGVSA